MGIFSTLFGGTKTKVNYGTTDTGPSKFQQPYLEAGFDAAGKNMQDRLNTPFYQGPLYAGQDALTTQGNQMVGSYASGAGQAAAGQVAGVGGALTGQTGAYMGALGAFQGAASADPTGGNIAAAARYADNPYLNSQIDASTRDIARTFNEDTNPQLQLDATAGGNINSSRSGVQAALAQRGAMDRATDVAAGIRSNAYQSGISTAESARQANLGALGTSAGLYGDAVGKGVAASGAGQAMTYANTGALQQAGAINQADQQGQYDADLKRWIANDTRNTGVINDYNGVVGAQQWGEYGTKPVGTTQSSSPGLLGSALGVASTVSGMGGVGGIGKLFGF